MVNKTLQCLQGDLSAESRDGNVYLSHQTTQVDATIVIPLAFSHPLRLLLWGRTILVVIL